MRRLFRLGPCDGVSTVGGGVRMEGFGTTGWSLMSWVLARCLVDLASQLCWRGSVVWWMLKNPVCLFVPECYCLFLHVLSHLDVELLAYSSVVWNSGICLANESTALLFHHYWDQCEREYHPYYLVPLAFQEVADQSIDFAVSDTVTINEI